MTEQLIRKDSPAAPPRRNTTQTPTIQHNLHDAPRRCVGVQPATLEPRVEPGPTAARRCGEAGRTFGSWRRRALEAVVRTRAE